MSNDSVPRFPQLKSRSDKVVASILYLITEAYVREIRLTRKQILDLLFVSDCDHLCEYGRPITFDNYRAVADQAEGLMAASMLDNTFHWHTLGLAQAPWDVVYEDGHTFFVFQGIFSDHRIMSPSDGEALEESIYDFAAYGQEFIDKHVHTHPAWVSARIAVMKNPHSSDGLMDLRMFHGIDEDLVWDLVEGSHGR